MPLIPKYTDLASRTPMDDIMYPLPKPKFAPRKPLHLPSAALRAFIQAADANSRRGIETCAVLMGREIDGEYYVTYLVLPDQRGEPNTVTTLREELLVLFQERMGVFTLGWVHTHPTQTCFLSSIDLHCQHAYQSGIPEAIAVVCAPHLKQTSVFALSDVGMDVLTACNKGGDNFHKHDAEYGLYGAAPHVQIHYPAGHPGYKGSRVCGRELPLPKVSGAIIKGQVPKDQVHDIGRARRCINEVEVVDFRKGSPDSYQNKGPSRKGSGVDLELKCQLFPLPGYVLPDASVTALPSLVSSVVFTNVDVESEQLSTQEKVDHAYSQVSKGAEAAAGATADVVTSSAYAIEDFLGGEKVPEGRVVGKEGSQSDSKTPDSSSGAGYLPLNGSGSGHSADDGMKGYPSFGNK
jgi:proteasome lid subunit RPN8/RPN11